MKIQVFKECTVCVWPLSQHLHCTAKFPHNLISKCEFIESHAKSDSKCYMLFVIYVSAEARDDVCGVQESTGR